LDAGAAGRADPGDAGAASDVDAGSTGGEGADSPFDANECGAVGGECMGIGECLNSGGQSTPPEIACEGGIGVACCVPYERCGEVDIECCSDGTTYRPACDGDQFVCVVGEQFPLGGCPL
jgi:hypothetical protein